LFQDDLLVGEDLERHILKKIQRRYPQARKIEGYFKGYDLFVPELQIRIEVKRDIKSQETGNYVIETEFDGKPSALSTTEADYWVIFDGECEIWTTPWRILEAVKGLVRREFIGKGDTKSKKAYLCPKERIKKTAEFVYEIHS
tara:strand:- start:414 stop:842 length:429 start_codon:yes stop_codon:yes gene_type:complete